MCFLLKKAFAFVRRPSKSGWQIGRQQPEPTKEVPDTDLPDGYVGMRRIVHNIVDQALLQSSKREVRSFCMIWSQSCGEERHLFSKQLAESVCASGGKGTRWTVDEADLQD